MPKPPVPAVPKVWIALSNSGIPPATSITISTAVMTM